MFIIKRLLLTLAAAVMISGCAGIKKVSNPAYLKGEVVEVTEDNFWQEVLNSDVPVVADFTSEYCHACKLYEPIFNKVAKKHEGELKFVKADTDKVDKATEKYLKEGEDYYYIPTTIIFEDGEKKCKEVGYMNESRLEKFIDKCLEKE